MIITKSKIERSRLKNRTTRITAQLYMFSNINVCCVSKCNDEKYTYIRDIELLVLSLQYKIALTVFLQKSTKRLKLIVNFFREF